MNVQSVSCVYFSPTKTTKKIVEGISLGINAEKTKMTDMTKRCDREGGFRKFGNEIVILATPVYYGRVPEIVASCFSKFEAKDTGVVLVVVYGNRAYEDALKELHDIAVADRFIPIAAGAFVAEHSYSSSVYPISQERPDNADMQKASEFGIQIREKFQSLKSMKHLKTIAVPGHTPYIEPENLNMIKKARSMVPLTPETDTSKCTQCGICAEVCPTEAISSDDVTQTDRWKCLICFACIKNCPEEARQMNEPHFQAAIQELHKACQERKEPELYL